MQELIVENYGSINADFKCKKLTIIEGKEKETILRLLYLFQKTASKIKADSDLDKLSVNFWKNWKRLGLSQSEGFIQWKSNSVEITVKDEAVKFTVHDEEIDKKAIFLPKSRIYTFEYTKKENKDEIFLDFLDEKIVDTIVKAIREDNRSTIIGGELAVEYGIFYFNDGGGFEDLMDLPEFYHKVLPTEYLFNYVTYRDKVIFLEKFGVENTFDEKFEALTKQLLQICKNTQVIMTLNNPSLIDFINDPITIGNKIGLLTMLETKLFTETLYLYENEVSQIYI